MNANSQSLGNEINSTPSSLANEVRRSSLLASGSIVGAGTASVHAQSVPIDMEAGLNNNNNSAMTAATVSKTTANNNAGAAAAPSGAGTPSGNVNGMNSGRISLVDGSTAAAGTQAAGNQQQQALQLQAQLAAMQGMQGMAGFGAAGLNPQLAAMAGMNMNPAMMNMMSTFGGGANANANGTGTAGDGSNSRNSNNATTADSSNGGTPTPNATGNKRDSAAAFMDTLNRDSFLAGAAAAASSSSADAMGAGQAGMDSMLSRSSLLAAAGGMGGMNLAAANPMMAQLMMQQQMQLMMQQQQLANAGAGNMNANAISNDGNMNANVNGLDASNGQHFPTATSAMFGPGGLGLVNPSAAAAAGMAAAAAAASQRPAKKARKSGTSSAKGSAATSLSAIANATPVGAAGTTTKPKDLKWLGMLGLLREYKAENGDCIVPRGYGPNPKLASWVAEQRKQYKLMRDGKPSNITPERVAALNELEFAWNAQEAAWARHYSDLRAYKAKFGDCLVPLSYTDRPQLGLWVKEQRRHYMLLVQGRKSHMTQARIAQLESVGFVWDSHEATWWDRFNDLKAYQAVHGNCMVPTKYQPNPRLGTWVHHQRRQYRKLKHGKTSHMTHERMEALESIGFCWTPRSGKDGNESD